MTGDLVEFEALRGGGSIEEILPRRNALVRPMAANIDKLLLVLSAGKPAPDLILADKLLIQAEKNKIEPVILINKTDMDRIQAEAIRRQYAVSYTHLYRITAAQSVPFAISHKLPDAQAGKSRAQ